MDEKTLQINKIKRAIGQLTFRVGTMQINEAISDFSDKEGTAVDVVNAVGKLGITLVPDDNKYYFMSWENWQKVIETINPINEQFKWLYERHDCDNRAKLTSQLVSLFFDVNTCGEIYCQVYDAKTGEFKYAHKANMIVDDADNVYLWDADNGGMAQKITTNNCVMGNLKYKLITLAMG